MKATEQNASKLPNPSDQGNTSSPLLPRILSGSIGSIVTALAVTPLEVVKIRQQLSTNSSAVPHSAVKASITPEPCPRGCTVVLNNGLMECVVPKSCLFEALSSNNYSRSFNPAQQMFLPRYNGGTLHTLSSILHYEGLSGLYAGLRPTLVMSVPNTVLYFSVYDEISSLMRRRIETNTTNHQCENDATIEEGSSQIYIPLIAGSTARLLASLSTAPLELIRTRQAGSVGEAKVSMLQEFRNLLRNNGLASLYVGLAPTLWRDVPFSAIYWMCLERFKRDLSNADYGKWGGRYYKEMGVEIPSKVEALHAFVSGAMAGCIAAAVTTPFDVVKTRRQMMASEMENQCSKQFSVGSNNLGILSHMQSIIDQEGILGLWKGNVTRMVKVAPACAIMISVYEFGKRAFGEVI